MVVNALLFAIVVSFILPIILALAFAKINSDKVSGGRLTLVFVLGGLVYIIAELLFEKLLIERGILPLLSETDLYYIIFERTTHSSIMYFSAYMGVVTGFLQEIVRFLVFYIAYKCFKKVDSVKLPLVFGMGSGFLDALICLGIMAITYLSRFLADSSIINDVGATRTLLISIERIIHLFYQTGYALLIVYGIKSNKKFLMTALTICVHMALTTVDICLGKFGLEYTTLNFINATMAAILVFAGFMLWRKPTEE